VTYLPSRHDVQTAYKTANAAMERGEDWLTAFDTCMLGFGYNYTGAGCQCEEREEDGSHEPQCGWESPEVKQ